MIENKRIRIGKTVIETLTQGMYEDARFIFREYIQNSADQIEIIFEDNATGIKNNNVYPILGNIALSEKDRTKDKGFRGIGRLGGLGYCKKLTFETSFKGEEVKSIMIWDAEK